MVQKAFENTKRMSFSYILNFPLILFLNLTLSFRKKNKLCVYGYMGVKESETEREMKGDARESTICVDVRGWLSETCSVFPPWVHD